MEMEEVASGTISHVGYDPTTQTLAVRFKHGGEYLYEGVSAEAHRALLGAESIGKHFMAHVRPHYIGVKVPQAEGVHS